MRPPYRVRRNAPELRHSGEITSHPARSEPISTLIKGILGHEIDRPHELNEPALAEAPRLIDGAEGRPPGRARILPDDLCRRRCCAPLERVRREGRHLRI